MVTAEPLTSMSFLRARPWMTAQVTHLWSWLWWLEHHYSKYLYRTCYRQAQFSMHYVSPKYFCSFHFLDGETEAQSDWQLLQGYTVSKWQSQGLNPGCLAFLNPYSLPLCHSVPRRFLYHVQGSVLRICNLFLDLLTIAPASCF